MTDDRTVATEMGLSEQEQAELGIDQESDDTPCSHSLVDEYMRYGADVTDAPVVFHKFCCLSVVSALVGNRVYFDYGDQRIYPNLWVILLAPSSTFRKSTTIGIARKLIAQVVSEAILPQQFSCESFVEMLARQPTGILIVPEFLSFTKLLDREYNLGLKSTLTELYDSPPYYKTRYKSSSYEIRDPCINILSATTIEWFLQEARKDDMFGGFYARFAYVPAWEKPGSVSWPKPADTILRNRLVKRFRQLRETKGELRFDQCLREYDEWYRRFESELNLQSSLLGPFHARLAIYALKYAALYELSSTGGLAVSPDSLKKGCELADYLFTQLCRLEQEEFALSWSDKRKKTVRRLIYEAGKKGIAHADLLPRSHLSAKELEGAIQTLIQSEEIVLRNEEREGTNRKHKHYYRTDKIK